MTHRMKKPAEAPAEEQTPPEAEGETDAVPTETEVLRSR